MKPTKTQVYLDPSPDGSPMGRALGLKANCLKDHARALVAEVESLNEIKALDISRGINLYEEVRRLEIELIQLALQQTGGHQTRAAQLLDIRPSTLNNKIKLYGISVGVLFGSRVKKDRVAHTKES